MNKVGIVIQARTGSTRLPNKMVLPFYENKSLLDIIIEKFKKDYHVILATSEKKSDQVLVEKAKKHGIDFFVGSENDVLSRFISVADEHNLSHIVRVCGDNPFIASFTIKELIDNIGNHDYVSFQTNKLLPTILSHLGFFAEVVKVSSLRKVSEETEAPIFREHVTNFIHTQPKKFDVSLLPMNEIDHYDGIRLTVDTKADFENAQILFENFGELKSWEEMQQLIDYIRINKEFLVSMNSEIEKNAK